MQFLRSLVRVFRLKQTVLTDLWMQLEIIDELLLAYMNYQVQIQQARQVYSVLYLPVDPPCSSGFGEEKVTVRQLLEPLSPHGHIKLTALQLIAISHRGAFVGVEAGERTVRSVMVAITHRHQTRHSQIAILYFITEIVL